MKIEINLKILFFLMLFFFLNKFDVYLIFILFIILHELSHMIIGIILGFKPKVLKVNPLGVSIEFYNYSENSKKNKLKRIFTYLAGPMLNLILAFIFCFLKFDSILKMKIIYTNILIGIFNLFPIIPLDGGKILKEILKLFYNYKLASEILIISSKTILILLTFSYSIAVLKLKNIAIFLLIMYLWYLYFIEEKRERILCNVYELIENNKLNKK